MPKNKNNKKEKTPLESLKAGLYRKDGAPRRGKRSSLYPQEFEAARGGWEDKSSKDKKKKKKMSLVTMIFIASLIFFVISAAVLGFVFLRGTNVVSSENVTIAVSAPASVEAGKAITLQILVENGNTLPLEFSDLLITYPEGTRLAGNVEEQLKRTRISLNTILPNQIVTETIQAVFFGQEGTNKELKIELEYRVEGSNAIFVAEKIYDIVISSSPIDLSVEVLREISSGQELTLKIRVRSNSTEIVENLLLQVSYPFGFIFTSASPSPAYNKDKWIIGDLSPGGERVITLRGILSGQDGEEKAFRSESGVASSVDGRSVGVVYSSAISVVEIARPFLGTRFSIDGISREEYSVESNKRLRASISWTNNTPTKITNAQIEVHFSGEVLDKSSVFAKDGFFRSIDNTIIWNQDTGHDLREIEPGATGRIDFQFSSLPLFTSDGSIFKSPRITIDITTRGERLGERGVPEEIKSTVSREIKIISDVGFTSRGVYFTGPLKNTGPLPPVAETETTYTIIWTAVNSSNNLSGATVNTILPNYVRFVGAVSPSSESVVYNERDRSVSWNIGVVRGGVGVSSPPREVAFQVAFLPSVSHVGRVIELIGVAIFSAHDEFSDVDITSSSKTVTTNLTTDPQFKAGQSIVGQIK